jgi:hypothetical protein
MSSNVIGLFNPPPMALRFQPGAAIFRSRRALPSALAPAGCSAILRSTVVLSATCSAAVLSCRSCSVDQKRSSASAFSMDRCSPHGEICRDAYLAPLYPESEIYLIPKIGSG